MPKLISIIVITYNDKDNTLKLLESLKKTDYPNYEIIMADNGSIDGTAEAVEKMFPNVKIVKNRKNLGYSSAVNLGFKEAKGDYIVPLNSDMLVFKADWLKILVQVLESEKNIGMVRPMFMNYDNPEISESNVYDGHGSVRGKENPITGFGMKDVGQFPEVVEKKWVGNAIIKREVFEKIGLYDDRFFLYFEDVDFSRRAKNAGYKLLIATRSKILHKRGETIGRFSKWRQKYYFYSSKLKYVLKWLFV